MRRLTRILAIVALMSGLGSVTACNEDEEVTTKAVNAESVHADLTPEDLGELGARIEAEPERLEELLTEEGLTQQTYEAAVRDVSESPDESRRYAQAYENARG